MNPILYESTETDFTNLGLGTLTDALSCVVTEERNGSYELTMTYPITGQHYSDILLRRLILAKPNYQDEPQPFRIYHISRPMSGIITINAEHISYDLSGWPVAPFEADNLALACSGLTSQALAAGCPFTIESDHTSSGHFKVDVPSSARSWLGGKEGSILDVYGGEWKYDLFKVINCNARGTLTGHSIRYGKNLIDLEQEENCAAVYTGVMAYWYDSESDTEIHGDVITVLPNANYTRILTVDASSNYDVQPTVQALNNYATLYAVANDVGTPKVSLTLDYLQLERGDWQNAFMESTYLTEDATGNYLGKNGAINIYPSNDLYPSSELYPSSGSGAESILYTARNTVPALQTNLKILNLCDTVSVFFEALGVAATAKVVKTVYNVLLERYNSLSLGSTVSTIADTIAGAQKALTPTALAATLAPSIFKATQLITGNSGGYVVVNDGDGDGYPDELLVMDQPAIEDAQRIWRWNKEGLGYSSTGYDGIYGTAITSDGAINADYISTGTLVLGNSIGKIGSMKVMNASNQLVAYISENGIYSYDQDAKQYARLNNGGLNFFSYVEDDDVYRSFGWLTRYTVATGYGVRLFGANGLSLGSNEQTVITGSDAVFLQSDIGVYCDAPLVPQTDATYNLGASNLRWNNIYAVNGTINTSDRKKKKNIKDLPKKFGKFFDLLKPKSFKHKDGDRIHVGFVAQDVEDALTESGMDAMDFGGLCKDGDDYGLRYSEFIALNTAEIQKLKAEIKEIKEMLKNGNNGSK